MAGRISKSVSGLIGLGQEAYQHHKDKNDSSTPPAATTTANDVEIDEDEDDWVADDAQDQLLPNSDDGKTEAEGAFEWFKKRHPQLAPASTSRLPAPVIVPQKRPDMRSRGFVRAYAPALAACDVDEAAFMDFLDGFHKDIKKHGYFNVSNIAVALSALTYTLSVAPSAIVHFSALAVHISIEAGRRLYISKKTNSYIDEMNAFYFQPRGLYAMIMAYKPGSKEENAVLDFDTAAATAVEGRETTEKSKFAPYKSSSGKMLDQQLPETCPLVFPELDKATDEQKENAFKRSLAFTREYYDKRSQAEFAGKNPGSKLSVQEQEFAGKHGDPTSYEHSGILGVVSGGRIDPKRRRFDKQNQLRQRLGKESKTSGKAGLLGKGGLVKRSLGENVLYLMIVNMPTEEELQAAKEAEEKMKREQPNWFEQLTGSITGRS